MLFDEFSETALLADPSALGKLLILFTYAHLLSLGWKVWSGRRMRKKDFVTQATKTRARESTLQEPGPFAQAHYALARCALYSICLGTLGELAGAPGVAAAWALALGGAATGLVKGGFDAATGVPKDASAFGWLRFLSTEEPTAVALPLLLALPMASSMVSTLSAMTPSALSTPATKNAADAVMVASWYGSPKLQLSRATTPCNRSSCASLTCAETLIAYQTRNGTRATSVPLVVCTETAVTPPRVACTVRAKLQDAEGTSMIEGSSELHAYCELRTEELEARSKSSTVLTWP